MDYMDKSILEDLGVNCRVTYQALAQKYNVSSNAIKRRIERLTESGVIENFTISLSWAMIDADTVLSHVYFDRSVNALDFLDKVGANPLVHMVGTDSYGCMNVVACYRGANDLAKLGEFLRSLDGVERVEMHPLIEEVGKKVKFTKLEIRVIAALLEGARMTVRELSKRTGLTARRVRRIIHDLIDNRGIHFTTMINWNAGDQTRVSFRIRWNETKIERNQIVEKVKEKYPDQLVAVYPSSMKPLMWIEFMIDHMREAEGIADWLTSNTSVMVMGTIIPYPRKRYSCLRDLRLQEILSEINH
jgi:DNA-binding Lrp family transcriptional regulator